MSLNKNIFANYAGVVVTTFLNFLVIPFYLRWMGPDAYGLIGISTMIQGWIMLLNAGLAPVAGRQAAQAQEGVVSWESAARFFRTIDWLLIGVSLPIVVLVIGGRDWIASHWLEQNNLGTETVAVSVVLLVAMTLVRLASSISRGIVANLELQIWLNTNLITFNILRFACSLPLIYFMPGINVLFVWWLIVALLEYASVQYKIIRAIPVKMPLFVFDVEELKKHGKMAGALAFTGGVWVVITNLDKLLLSGMLSLANYGYYSIATTLASGVLTLAQPVAQAFQPRLTKAFASGGIEAACVELRRCTHWVVLLVVPVGAVIFALPVAVLFLWTHDNAVAANAANILRGYVLGSTLIAAGGLLYVLQVAIGNVRWHLIGNVIFALILIPSLPWTVSHFGAEGAAWLWGGFNLLLFLGWNTFLLNKIAKPLLPRWLLIDTLLPITLSFALALGFKFFLLDKLTGSIALLIGIICLTLFISASLWFISVKRNFTLKTN